MTFIRSSGDLFDAYQKRDMPHAERMICVFRARHFMTIWRWNITQASKSYPDLFQVHSNFLSDPSLKILVRVCDQFILLALAHLEYHPTVPFLPWHHGSHFMEHFFGVGRGFNDNFSYAQFLEMYKHIELRVRILLTGRFNPRREKDSNNGYVFDHVAKLSPSEVRDLRRLPSRSEIDLYCGRGWEEASFLASELCGLAVPPLPLEPSEHHTCLQSLSEDAESLDLSEPIEDSEDSCVEAEDKQFEYNAAQLKDVDGEGLTPSASVAFAALQVAEEAKHREQSERADEELVKLQSDLQANPDLPITGRILISSLLNPAPVPTRKDSERLSLSKLPLSLIPESRVLSYQPLLEHRARHSATTSVHSEKERVSETASSYVAGKFSLNAARHQLASSLEADERLRGETTFQKARLHRWRNQAPVLEWKIGCSLRDALTTDKSKLPLS
jgi:hypothetical protein